VDVVVDASVALKWLVDESGSKAALELRAENEIIAPDLLLIECRNALLTKFRRGELTRRQAQEAAADLDSAGLSIVPSAPLLDHAYALALDLQQPIYDCIYLATAVTTERRLITADRRFAAALARTEFAKWVSVLTIKP
jgi:predicted nucleic acid-binding protein